MKRLQRASSVQGNSNTPKKPYNTYDTPQKPYSKD